MASTLPAHAQPSAAPVIGYLGLESPGPSASRVAALRKGLAESGYAEGRNLAIDFRWAEGRYDRLPALAAKVATTTIPIVFEMGGDPIALSVVGSLSRPGGNLTGVSSLSVEVSPKRLEFMHEVIPNRRDRRRRQPDQPDRKFAIEKPPC